MEREGSCLSSAKPIHLGMGAQRKPDLGSPGASARREAERRREARRRQQPRGLIATLRRSSATGTGEKSWATGAEGEELVAESLASRCPEVPVLHDRRMPGSRANIDHVAAAGTGVYVIDAKRYRGRVEVSKPFFGESKLRIAGRDRTKLVIGLAKQVAAVEAAVAELMRDVPVHGCFCFVAPEGVLADSGIPTLRTLRIDDFRLFRGSWRSN